MHLYPEPQSGKEAVQIQKNLRQQLRLDDDHGPIRIIAGVDVGYDTRRKLAKAAIVTMTPEELVPIETLTEYRPVSFPYIPGLLSFREARCSEAVIR